MLVNRDDLHSGFYGNYLLQQNQGLNLKSDHCLTFTLVGLIFFFFGGGGLYFIFGRKFVLESGGLIFKIT